MTTVISFCRNATLQNILLDEYFSEHTKITVIAFNYDGAGTALCRCDDALAEIDKANLRKIIFGGDRKMLEAYLTSVFDPESEDDSLPRQNGAPLFRLPTLQNMKKYDVANLAKQTLKEVQALTDEFFHYYCKADEAPSVNSPRQDS